MAFLILINDQICNSSTINSYDKNYIREITHIKVFEAMVSYNQNKILIFLFSVIVLIIWNLIEYNIYTKCGLYYRIIK